MPVPNHYLEALGGREPLAAMRETADRIDALANSWSAEAFERSYAPGKWSARLILTHLAQTEMVLSMRARMALSTPRYVAQPFDQDRWIEHESNLSGQDALDTFLAVDWMNIEFFRALSEAERETTFEHPEYGAMTINHLIQQLAGHAVHHLKQLEQIAAA